jgi:hypothetical protein
MSAVDLSAIAVGIISVLGGVAAFLQFLVKHYLSELKPNSGSSLRDEIKRLETRVDKIYELLVSRGE